MLEASTAALLTAVLHTAAVLLGMPILYDQTRHAPDDKRNRTYGNLFVVCNPRLDTGLPTLLLILTTAALALFYMIPWHDGMCITANCNN